MSEKQKRQLLTTGEVAALADVDASTVSNWRRRFEGSFPQPALMDDEGKRPKFDRSEVVEWLRQNPRVGGRRNGTQGDLGRVFDLLRGTVKSDDHAEVVGRILEGIESDSRPNSDGHIRSSAEVRALLDDGQVNRDLTAPPYLQPGVEDKELVAVYTLLLSVADRLAFYDAALAERSNRLSESSETTTPVPLVEFLTALAAPTDHGFVIDPVAGYGSLLLSCIRGGKASLGLGVDISAEAVRIANRRFLLADVNARSEIGDSLVGDALGSVRADLVIADPPLGLMFRSAAADSRSVVWEFGTPKSSNADTAWLQLAISRLLPGGRAIVVTTLGTLFQTDKATTQIRNEMVRRGAVQAIFTLPARLRTNTAVRLAVWVLTTPDSSERRTNVLLVDLATDDSTAIEPAGKGVAAFMRWMDDAGATIDPTFAVAVPVIDLLAPDATLLPSRWISAEEDSLDAGDWKHRVDVSYQVALEMLGRDLHLPGIAIAPNFTAPERTTIGELVKRGVLAIVRGRHMERYDGSAESYPIMSVRDVRARRLDLESVSDRAATGPSVEAQLVQPGDVLVYPDGDKVVARVWQESGWVLGRFMQVLRIADGAWNAHYLAAAINSPTNIRYLVGGVSRTHFNLADFDVVVQSASDQRMAQSMEEGLEDLATRLAESAAAVQDVKAEMLNAVASGLVRADFR